MPGGKFEPTIPEFELAKIDPALDHGASVIGKYCSLLRIPVSSWSLLCFAYVSVLFRLSCERGTGHTITMLSYRTLGGAEGSSLFYQWHCDYTDLQQV
jgi:hypothetical protein